MQNDYLEYYGKYHISPVCQNLDDIEVHYSRREKLYRQCGIPVLAFRNAEILEVGPGGGYNTLALFKWNCKHVDLVEANPKGIEDMKELFSNHNIVEEKYDIFQSKIEEFETDKKYDIIIAEGFIPYIQNQKEVIDQLKELIEPKGIIVITCVDHVSLFVEVIKRLIGVAYTKDIKDYEQKVNYLSALFEPQLKCLKGVSRSAKEWVQDQILNPAGSNGTEMSLLSAIEYFGNEFDVMGSSPRMFTDYSWYKDIWYDYKKDYKNQFQQKRLSLLLVNMPEKIFTDEQSYFLIKHFENIKKYGDQYERTLDLSQVRNIVKEMDGMESILKSSFSHKFINVFDEIREILLGLSEEKDIEMENYPNFFQAFGRTQQYISFVKK